MGYRSVAKSLLLSIHLDSERRLEIHYQGKRGAQGPARGKAEEGEGDGWWRKQRDLGPSTRLTPHSEKAPSMTLWTAPNHTLGFHSIRADS